jgi:hypothetical protein
MKLLALLVGLYGISGFAAAAVIATMQDSRGQPLIFGLGALVMGVAGLRAARSIWRRHAAAERHLYVWGATTLLLLVELAAAFPYAFARQTTIWPPVVIGLVLFTLLITAAGRFIRHRAPAV